MNDSKDDKQDCVNQQETRSSNRDPGLSSGPPTNNKGHATNERDRGRDEIAVEACGKRTVSARKIEANRRNSRKSTGPNTVAGKKRASKNAIRHGFYSKCLLVQHPDGKEDRAEYDDLYLGVREHYHPVGWLEEFRVEEIALLSWRRRRLLRWESGMIAKALATHSYYLQESRTSSLEEPEAVPSSSPEMDAITDHLFLPSNEELEKLLRYEALLNRQLNHAFAELERLQARRKEGSTRVGIGNITEQSQEPL
jgi:hypothetical protein